MPFFATIVERLWISNAWQYWTLSKVIGFFFFFFALVSQKLRMKFCNFDGKFENKGEWLTDKALPRDRSLCSRCKSWRGTPRSDTDPCCAPGLWWPASGRISSGTRPRQSSSSETSPTIETRTWKTWTRTRAILPENRKNVVKTDDIKFLANINGDRVISPAVWSVFLLLQREKSRSHIRNWEKSKEMLNMIIMLITFA